MKRFGMAGLAAMVVMVALVLLPALASASSPEWVSCGKASPRNTGLYTDKACSSESATHTGRYELVPGIGKGKAFKGEGRVEFNQVNEKARFSVNGCAGKTKISGSYQAPNKLHGLVISMTKCFGAPFGAKSCSFSTAPLAGQLGWVDQAKGEAGLELASESGESGVFAENSSCFGGVTVIVRGSLIARLSPVGTLTSAFALSTSEHEEFDEEEKCDLQRNTPTAFEGEATLHSLISELAGPEQFRCRDATLTGEFHILKGETLMVR